MAEAREVVITIKGSPEGKTPKTIIKNIVNNKVTNVINETKQSPEVSYDDEGNRIGSPSEDIVVDDHEVKTYTLFESIEIPKCYYNLPSGVSNCFPLLKLEIPGSIKYRPYRRTQFSGLSIAKIFIDPVRE